MSVPPINISRSDSSEAPIFTKEYVHSPAMVLPLVRSRLRRQYFILFLILSATFTFVASVRGEGLNGICLISMVIAFAVIFLFIYFNAVVKAQGQIEKSAMLSPSQLHEISDGFFTTYLADGTFSKNSIRESFRLVEKRADHYLCYTPVSGTATIIPLDAFESEADRQRFEAILQHNRIPIIYKK